MKEFSPFVVPPLGGMEVCRLKPVQRTVCEPSCNFLFRFGLILQTNRLQHVASPNRDRGRLRSLPPPTPPGIRVRTTAVRLVKLWVQVDSIKLSLLVGLSVIEDAALGTVPAWRSSGDSSLPSATKARRSGCCDDLVFCRLPFMSSRT